MINNLTRDNKFNINYIYLFINLLFLTNKHIIVGKD